MQTYYRLYAKFEGQKRFKPLDLSTGEQVTNLIHATMIPEENFDPPDEIFGVFEREIELLVGPGDNEEQERKLKEMFKFTITDEYTVQVVKTEKVDEGGAGLAEGGGGAR